MYFVIHYSVSIIVCVLGLYMFVESWLIKTKTITFPILLFYHSTQESLISKLCLRWLNIKRRIHIKLQHWRFCNFCPNYTMRVWQWKSHWKIQSNAENYGNKQNEVFSVSFSVIFNAPPLTIENFSVIYQRSFVCKQF